MENGPFPFSPTHSPFVGKFARAGRKIINRSLGGGEIKFSISTQFTCGNYSGTRRRQQKNPPSFSLIFFRLLFFHGQKFPFQPTTTKKKGVRKITMLPNLRINNIQSYFPKNLNFYSIKHFRTLAYFFFFFFCIISKKGEGWKRSRRENKLQNQPLKVFLFISQYFVVVVFLLLLQDNKRRVLVRCWLYLGSLECPLTPSEQDSDEFEWEIVTIFHGTFL